MSEVQSRPSAPRGRSSARGARGGYSSRGPRSQKQTNGDHQSAGSIDASAEEGELAQLRQQYATQLATIRETFPDWTDLDLLLALHDSDGDLNVASERILEGQVSQFAEVKKNDRSRSKVKDTSAVGSDANAPSTSTRGRGRFEGTRGGRGRGTERGRGGFRGGRGGAHAANGSRSGAGVSVPTTESSAWDTTAATTDANNAWDTDAPTNSGAAAADDAEAKPAATPEAVKKPAAPQEPPKKTWASMFAKPKPAPAPPKPAAVAPPPEPAAPEPVAEPEPTKEIEKAVEAEELPIPPVADEAPAAETAPAAPAEPPVVTPEVPELPSAQITPSKDELTKENVENLPDLAEPAPTGTAASTVASGSVVGVATPLTGAQRTQAARPGPAIGGFATVAQKATAPQGRSSSYQRKVLDQQEAVVMPGNHAVDRAAVQFGSLGLNGDAALDVDEDREEAETRTQPPQHSPTQQPRTSLPPAPRQPAVPSESQVQESVPTPKPAPGLPPVNQQAQQQSPAIGGQAAQPYSQFGRYGQANIQSEPAGQAQKPYDPFGAPVSQPNQFDSFPSHTQPQNIQQPQVPSTLGGFSSAPNDYSSYYTSDQQRNAYQNYYGAGYGQQTGGNQQQEVNAQEQRTSSGFGPAGADSGFPTSQSQQVGNNPSISFGTVQARRSGARTSREYSGLSEYPASSRHRHSRFNSDDSALLGSLRPLRNLAMPSISQLVPNLPSQNQSRYGDAQNSGHNTPVPAMAAQHHPAAQSQHMHQPHGQTGHSGFPYSQHPYYNTPYFNAYMNHYGGAYGGQGYGAPFGKGMYGQPNHGYGMSPQTTYDAHSSSPANVGAFGASSMHARDSALGGGLGDYRASSTQPSQTQQHTASSGAFGGMPDVFGRNQGVFPGQGQPYGQQQSASQAGAEDALKPFGDKGASGPSPSSIGQPGRPGSATNSVGQGAQSGLPPPQSHQQGFGAYPGSQYGLGGLGGHQGGQGHSGGYGGYGAGFGSYGSYGRGGGWGGNYGAH
ncbi:RNAPII degradation factor [Diplodia intermedia]|uniref:RNAPII degradation factor n=1 Tax=Diplodia intermedia TaxID=856260 RepID=A0ABR3U3I3_9PEZI